MASLVLNSASILSSSLFSTSLSWSASWEKQSNDLQLSSSKCQIAAQKSNKGKAPSLFKLRYQNQSSEARQPPAVVNQSVSTKFKQRKKQPPQAGLSLPGLPQALSCPQTPPSPSLNSGLPTYMECIIQHNFLKFHKDKWLKHLCASLTCPYQPACRFVWWATAGQACHSPDQVLC